MKLRFAPSPTGLLHVGNARLALINALYARRHGADFQLRIDDTDPERSRPEYEAAIREDLGWLGIGWSESFRQSERLHRYAEAAERLKVTGRLYPCFESADELRVKRELRLKQGRAPVYDRAMLKLTAEQRAQAEANGKVPYWRFRLSDTVISWPDLVGGERQVKLTAVSDPVLIRADGTVLYGFASVVDDLESGVTHILRGEDHLTNTGVQIDLADALVEAGAARRRRFHFGHVPLLLDSEGGKLSKRFEGLSLRTLRHDGILPEALAGYLARLGTADAPVAASLDELAGTYDLGRVSSSAARFDMSHLLALNRLRLRATPFSDIATRLPEGATEPFWLAIRDNIDLLDEARHWWSVVAGDIAVPVGEADPAFLAEAEALLPPEPWDEGAWGAWTAALRQASGRSGRALFHPLRLALTAEEQGPELRLLLPQIGRQRVIARLRAAAS
ncbi:glutamyl-tRNA synthetase [Endobacter medicaginis]|uniref:Glutamate--tRNA ligase n=3 Tax=Endobacter medicaginis TaxID=1181271 RepID=A0A839UX92_9PROT|nr:glutamate--tRNA ligase [Endobacter medicaginis]MBB3172993.1 glutamyl-tRNA synthetase [Endobacter medicaginis]MCX5475227.1 glutamate--tRNA ligase [Endobacter medicaginis]